MSAKHEWLNLLEVSGPFLAVLGVLRRCSPGPRRAGRLARQAPAQRLRGGGATRSMATTPTATSSTPRGSTRCCVRRSRADDQLLKAGQDVPASVVALPEHDTTITPELVFIDPTHGWGGARAGSTSSRPTPTLGVDEVRRASCSPGDRMAMHLRALNVPFGLVTNGERWMLVHAPAGQVATFASWYAHLEPGARHAARVRVACSRAPLLRARAGPAPALFERSLEHQDEVTDALGDQVRRAIEVLVQALDRADQDPGRDCCAT